MSRNRHWERIVPGGDAQVACVAISKAEIEAGTTLIGEAKKEGDRRQKKNVSEKLELVCLPLEIAY